MKRRAARVDANQADIVSALERAGAKVRSLAAVGDGMYDLLVGFRGVLALLEVKDGAKPQSARTLTPMQVEFRRDWAGSGPIYVVTSVDEALEAIGVKAKP